MFGDMGIGDLGRGGNEKEEEKEVGRDGGNDVKKRDGTSFSFFFSSTIVVLPYLTRVYTPHSSIHPNALPPSVFPSPIFITL